MRWMEGETGTGQLRRAQESQQTQRKAHRRKAYVKILHRIKGTRATGLGPTSPATNTPVRLITGTLC